MTGKTLVEQTAFLVVFARHGKREIQVFYDFIPYSVRNERKIGGLYPIEQILDLPHKWCGKSMDEINHAWQTNNLFDKTPVQEVNADELQQRLDKKLARLDAIIRTSHFEGEKEAARRYYKELTGKEWKP